MERFEAGRGGARDPIASPEVLAAEVASTPPPPWAPVPPERRPLSRVVAEHAEPIESVEGAALGPLLERVGDARVVLIGCATSGTAELHAMQARITRALIEHAGFTVVALEADGPDLEPLDRYVRRRLPIELRCPPLIRFPGWVWRHRATQTFVEWLAVHNVGLPAERQVSLHGLDLYGRHHAMGAALDYFDHVDPAAARRAREHFGGLCPWAPAASLAAPGPLGDAKHGRGLSEDELVAPLVDLLRERAARAVHGDEIPAASLLEGAERYYRELLRGSLDAWNLGVEHMNATLEATRAQRAGARAVVWAHSSFVGDMAATEMGSRGATSLGRLARERHDGQAYLIGCATDRGTVLAAPSWGARPQVRHLPPAHRDSYERICRDSGVPAFLLPLRTAERLRAALFAPHLERAIGTVYRPETELASHYFHAALPVQFDELVWFERTRALEPRG